MRAAIFLSLIVTASLLSGCHQGDPQQANAFMGMPPDMTNNLYPYAPAGDGKPAQSPAPAPAPAK
jgi:hypothetical protein